MKVPTKAQNALCEKCSFLSPECFPNGDIDCYGNENRQAFIHANGFAPLPADMQTEETEEG